MWKPEHRRVADCNDLRYPSDLTDAEWAIVEPMIPPGRHGGRKRSVNVREVLNGIFYVLWMPMEGTAQGSAAQEHGARLCRTLELGRLVGASSSAPPTRRMPLGQASGSPELIPRGRITPGFDIV
jgi:hypothetical protein